jgi:hypothetical protein
MRRATIKNVHNLTVLVDEVEYIDCSLAPVARFSDGMKPTSGLLLSLLTYIIVDAKEQMEFQGSLGTGGIRKNMMLSDRSSVEPI